MNNQHNEHVSDTSIYGKKRKKEADVTSRSLVRNESIESFTRSPTVEQISSHSRDHQQCDNIFHVARHYKRRSFAHSHALRNSTHGINTVFRATRLTMTSEVPHDSTLVEAAAATELSR
uniref:Uncharacterized protein n=1 Tax=Caenorhabditis japonica TaxID=281687 RepID=A0A8R1IR84_CAEJA